MAGSTWRGPAVIPPERSPAPALTRAGPDPTVATSVLWPGLGVCQDCRGAFRPVFIAGVVARVDPIADHRPKRTGTVVAGLYDRGGRRMWARWSGRRTGPSCRRPSPWCSRSRPRSGRGGGARRIAGRGIARVRELLLAPGVASGGSGGMARRAASCCSARGLLLAPAGSGQRAASAGRDVARVRKLLLAPGVARAVARARPRRWSAASRAAGLLGSASCRSHPVSLRWEPTTTRG